MWKASIAAVALLAVGSMAGIIRDYPVGQLHNSPSTTTFGGYVSHGHSGNIANDPYPLGANADHVVAHAEPAKHETKHEHKHKPATSHQTFKIHHFHAVPVYVKKEHQHLLKHPLEIGGVNHKLKQIHPEAVKSHGHGYVLENHTDSKHKHHHHDSQPAIGVKHASEQIAHLHELTLGKAAAAVQSDEHNAGVGPLQFHDINVHNGGPSYD